MRRWPSAPTYGSRATREPDFVVLNAGGRRADFLGERDLREAQFPAQLADAFSQRFSFGDQA